MGPPVRAEATSVAVLSCHCCLGRLAACCVRPLAAPGLPWLPRTYPRTHSVSPTAAGRVATVKRVTKETSVSVTINLDGTGQCHSKSGVRSDAGD